MIGLDVITKVFGRVGHIVKDALEVVAGGDNPAADDAREALAELEKDQSPESIAEALAALPAEVTDVLRLKLNPVDRNSSDI